MREQQDNESKGVQPAEHERRIVSFVRRNTRLTPKLRHAWDEYAESFLLKFPAADDQRPLGVADDYCLDGAAIKRIWGNDNPLVIEVGSGQGENIAAAAQDHPSVNYLAVEVFDQGVAHTLLRCGKHQLTNLRIAQVDAVELFEKALEPDSVEEVWTYFPDPWPKMKHHKRRIIQRPFALAVLRALKLGGAWRIATDIDDYALHVHEVMDDCPGFANAGTISVSLATEHVGKGTADLAASMPHAQFRQSPRFEGRVLTSFEKKGLDKGHTVHDFTYVKQCAENAVSPQEKGE